MLPFSILSHICTAENNLYSLPIISKVCWTNVSLSLINFSNLNKLDLIYLEKQRGNEASDAWFFFSIFKFVCIFFFPSFVIFVCLFVCFFGSLFCLFVFFACLYVYLVCLFYYVDLAMGGDGLISNQSENGRGKVGGEHTHGSDA